MPFQNKKIGFGVTGSHCTLEEAIPYMKELRDKGADVYPFITPTVLKTDTKFGAAEKWLKKIQEASGKAEVVDSIVKAEPFGPKTPLDAMVIAPMTGNSISRFANAITDSPVLMGAKATLRNGRPIVLAISTNDALGLNGSNILKLMNAKNIYFVPFGQDNPVKKPTSLVARMEDISLTLEEALSGRQYQPVIIEKFKD
ncbi:dipicolinate synthase subunit B [Alteribacillus persepolensis]|uniref:Dipicolinate synthase subunit B n=1 Tax=Alteribacillus persepolensis TaxID=568899 RepID=A0A1G7YUU2_9BACI|nr:dipicolinate synthase subunit B [Alteribacillus persepolensis]SDG99630.1 dipicolinate synthase subunit B [Alteribacillus persepolensis]